MRRLHADDTASNRALAGAFVCATLVAAFADQWWLSAAGGLTAVLCSNYLALHPYIQSALVRPAIRVAPYFITALNCAEIPRDLSLIGLASATIPVLTAHAINWRSMRLLLNRTINKIQPPVSMPEKLGQSLYFALGGVGQELFYRGVLMSAVLAHEPGVMTVVAMSALISAIFVAEHAFSLGNHIRRTPANYVFWFGVSTYFCAVVAITGDVLAVVIAHGLLNVPLALRPLLRRTKAPAPIQPVEE